MSLLDEIKLDLINDNANLANTLRKAKILASRLQLREFTAWVKYELEGYPNKGELPNYRVFRAHNVGTFSGPFHAMLNNITLPTVGLPESLKDFAENLPINHGIGELEAMLNSDSKDFQIKWPQEAIMLARGKIQMSNGMVLVDAYQPINKHIIAGIIDNIKNKLMDFILDLENSDINIDTIISKQEDKEQIRNMFNINIYGSDNIVASGENVFQLVKQINPGDINSLLNYMRSLSVPEEDIKLLNDSIKNDDKVTQTDQFGNRVKKWLGNVIIKASSGAWKISLELIPKLIIEALNKYYGL